MKKYFRYSLMVLLTMGVGGLAYAVDDFALLDSQGQFHKLYYYSDMKAVVLISQENGCPIIQKSYAYLEELKKKYASRGVVFLMINANPQDDRDAINKEAGDYGVSIPILEDRSQMITGGLGINRAAEAVLIDTKDWSIVYQGAISDQFGYETQKTFAVRNYLEEAMESLLSHKPVAVPRMRVLGCLFDFPAKADKPAFVHDIAPILINRCIMCHSPGQIAPWSMDDYAKVKSHGAMIREVIRTRRMPPWGRDPYYGQLKYDMSLTPQETRLIVEWIDEGMKRGEGRDPLLSALRPPTDGWPMGKPDMVISFKQEQSVPATGNLNYRLVEGEGVLDKDEWLKAVYWRPGNRKVLHHAHLLAVNPMAGPHQQWFYDSGRYYDLGMVATHKNYHEIDNYSPGTAPLLLSDDTGMFLPKGTRFAFSLHYTVTGKPETDNTQVGLYFHKYAPRKILSIYYYHDKSILIPPHVKDYKVYGKIPIMRSMDLYAIKPHMHLRGKSMRFTVHYPGGASRVILSVPNYKYYWQQRYYFKEPLHLPAGSWIKVEAAFDNSSQNPINPDPDKMVRWGDNTRDEMLVAVLYYVKGEGPNP